MIALRSYGHRGVPGGRSVPLQVALPQISATSKILQLPRFNLIGVDKPALGQTARAPRVSVCGAILWGGFDHFLGPASF